MGVRAYEHQLMMMFVRPVRQASVGSGRTPIVATNKWYIVNAHNLCTRKNRTLHNTNARRDTQPHARTHRHIVSGNWLLNMGLLAAMPSMRFGACRMRARMFRELCNMCACACARDKIASIPLQADLTRLTSKPRRGAVRAFFCSPAYRYRPT